MGVGQVQQQVATRAVRRGRVAFERREGAPKMHGRFPVRVRVQGTVAGLPAVGQGLVGVAARTCEREVVTQPGQSRRVRRIALCFQDQGQLAVKTFTLRCTEGAVDRLAHEDVAEPESRRSGAEIVKEAGARRFVERFVERRVECLAG